MDNKDMIQVDPRMFMILVETMGEGVTLSDKTGRFVIYNSKMKEITGYSEAEAGTLTDLLGFLYKDFVEHREAMLTVQSIYQRACRDMETVICAKDGTAKTLIVSTSIPVYQGERFYLNIYREIASHKKAEEEQTARKKDKHLDGLLSICSYCKKVHDDGNWRHIDAYVAERSNAVFTHGICPGCAKKHYPEFLTKSAEEKE